MNHPISPSSRRLGLSACGALAAAALAAEAQAVPSVSSNYRLMSEVTASGAAADPASASYRLEALAGEGYSTAWVVSSGERMNPGFLLRADPPTVGLSLSPASGSEAEGTAIAVTATASQAAGADRTVEVQVSGAGITAGDYGLSSATITIPAGQTSGGVTFTIQDDALVEGGETATLTLANPSAGLTLGATISGQVAIADNDYNLTLLSAGQGAVEGGGIKTAGATVNLAATPDAGYALGGWSPAPCAASFAMPESDLTCTASFVPNSYGISISVSPTEGGTVQCLPNPVAHGGTVVCTATPAQGYLFMGFGGDCSGPACTIGNITGPVSVTARFQAPPQPIPIFGAWGALALSGLMGLFAAGAWRRRRGR